MLRYLLSALIIAAAASASAQSSRLNDPCAASGMTKNGVCTTHSDTPVYSDAAATAALQQPCRKVPLNAVCTYTDPATGGKATGMCVIKKFMGTQPVCMLYGYGYPQR